MRVEESEGAFWIRVTVNDLVRYHREGKVLYRVEDAFQWRLRNGTLDEVATPEDFFGETELDFAEEYLLLHGSDEIAFPWESLDP